MKRISRSALSCVLGAAALGTLWTGGCGSTVEQLGPSPTQPDASAGSGTAGDGSSGAGGTSAGAGGSGNGGASAGSSGAAAGSAGVGTAGNAGVAGNSGGAVIPCSSDKVCTPNHQLCDPNRMLCVSCLGDTDCPIAQSCIAGSCTPFTACQNSLACGANQVCDASLKRCVECLTNADCPSTSLCALSQCRPRCSSDKDCTAMGQLCDQSAGHCSQCLKDADCGPTAHCAVGWCTNDSCVPLQGQCVGTELFSCDTQGTGFSVVTCAEGCTDAGGAHCASGGAGGEAGASGSGGSAGDAGSGGNAGSAGASGSGGGCNPEMVAINDCCMTPTQTAKSYSGVITITVGGVVYGAPSVPSDPFYYNFDTTLTKCIGCIVYNRQSEGACPCATECPTTSHFLTDLLVGGYPAYNAQHQYTVQIDLGTGAAQPLNLGYGDGGCYDNSGSFNLSIACQ